MRPLSRVGNYISTRIGRAIADYKLIEDKDRILVGVSGGKDSLAMLRLLNERKKWAPVKYELIAMHVETDLSCSAKKLTARLKKIFEKENVKYKIRKIKVEDRKLRNTNCFWCSWSRRKELFVMADKLGCNKIALGHHKDDIIETLLLNIFYNGEFAAMNPRQELFKGKLAIIRPLCYVEEKFTRAFAKENKFPTEICKCPSAEISRRRFVKEMIRSVERTCPAAKTNIARSISRVKEEYLGLRTTEK